VRTNAAFLPLGPVSKKGWGRTGWGKLHRQDLRVLVDHELSVSSVFKGMKPGCILGWSAKSVAKKSIIPLNSTLVRLHITAGKLHFRCI